MGLARLAKDMVATKRLLDLNATMGTVLDPKLLLCQPQRIGPSGRIVLLGAGQTVVDDVASNHAKQLCPD